MSVVYVDADGSGPGVGPGVVGPGVVGVMMGVADVVMSLEDVADVVMNVDVNVVVVVVVVVEGFADVVVASSRQGVVTGQASVGQGQKGSHTSLKNCSIFTVKMLAYQIKNTLIRLKKLDFFYFLLRRMYVPSCFAIRLLD